VSGRLKIIGCKKDMFVVGARSRWRASGGGMMPSVSPASRGLASRRRVPKVRLMATSGETQAERDARRHHRTLFDGAAALYEATRPGYPRELVEFVSVTAGLGSGSAVLEVGCGTGQLTGHLAALGFTVTAIDIGPALIAAARARVHGRQVTFRRVPFEELDVPGHCLDLIISGAAFHWIDPEVRFAKSARLLREGGWLAVAGNSDTYDEPAESALHGMWQARAGDLNGPWVTQRVDAAVLASTGLFGTPVERAWSQRLSRTAEQVIGVENTRSVTLSWSDDVRSAFSADLRRYLEPRGDVGLTVKSPVIMAPVLP
jgi:SAM-dependent methyltransferase